jgi:hypothetical protein
LLTALGLSHRLDFRNGVFPPLQLLLRNLVHPPKQRICRGRISGESSGVEQDGR